MSERLRTTDRAPYRAARAAIALPARTHDPRDAARPLAWLTLLIIATLLWLPSPGQAAAADHRWPIGDYVVNANAVRTDFLSPEVARKLGIERSNDHAVLTVSVQKDSDKPIHDVVDADVRVIANSMSKRWTLGMQPREVGGVTFYVGTLPIRNRQRVNFDVHVAPDGSNQSGDFSFSRVFGTQ